jgi:hypothetical protein
LTISVVSGSMRVFDALDDRDPAIRTHDGVSLLPEGATTPR